MSFFRKRYVSSKNAAISYANTIFCSRCFEHFRSKPLLENHVKVCGKETHNKVFPDEAERIEYKNHENNFKRIFADYIDFRKVLEDTHSHLGCSECGSLFEEDEGQSDCTHCFTIQTKRHRAI